MRSIVFNAKNRRYREVDTENPDSRASEIRLVIAAVLLCLSSLGSVAQNDIPSPGAPRSVAIPSVKETKLRNGLKIAVVEKRSVPIVTISLLISAGAAIEGPERAGLADITASMLTKGTRTRTARQIAEQMEFLGGSIESGAGWNSSFVTISITSDKLDTAMALMADAVLNPTFPQPELDLLKSQAVDGLTYNLTQPGFLTSYVASVYAFDEHPAGGTLESLSGIKRADVTEFYKDNFHPSQAVLIVAGDVTSARMTAIAARLFATWREPRSVRKEIIATMDEAPMLSVGSAPETPLLRNILVVDLPKSGQASVSYALPVFAGRATWEENVTKVDTDFYQASVMNSLLGGGYSSRLNQEIRLKRGLSYGAGSGFAWRWDKSNFSARTQTKNESAAEVAELVLIEIKRLVDDEIPKGELDPRKSVLMGGFGRNIETTGGLVGAMADLYTFGLPIAELNRYMPSVNAVTDRQIRDFAKANLLGGDLIIVGDYEAFKADLAKRFPNRPVTVVKAAELDISSETLRKGDVR